MYKPGLLVALYSEYEDAAKKFMEARDRDAEEAEELLCLMKLIGKNIDYTHRMMDGTMGKMPLERNPAHSTSQAMQAAGLHA